MSKLKLILGIGFGGALALLAAWIGIHSLGSMMAPQSAFALIAEVPLDDSSKPFAVSTGNVGASKSKKTAVAKKSVPPVLPVTPVVSANSFTPVPSPPPVATAPVAPAPTPVVPVTTNPLPQPSAPVQPQPTPVPAPPPVAPASAPSGSGFVIISEVMVGSETSGEDEFIELYNLSAQPIDLSGWSIKKRSSKGTESALVAAARLQGKSIPPQTYFLIIHDGSRLAVTGADAAWAKSNTLAAKNNAIILYDLTGQQIEEVVWAEIPKGSSYARIPLMEGGQFSVQGTPTPRQ